MLLVPRIPWVRGFQGLAVVKWQEALERARESQDLAQKQRQIGPRGFWSRLSTVIVIVVLLINNNSNGKMKLLQHFIPNVR